MSGTKPQSLDAAYERQAIEQGWKVKPVFPENQQWGEKPPVKNNKPIIHKLVIDDVNSRLEFGTKKYGTGLQPFNGRDALKDAYEEALDLCNYLRQALYERDGK